MKGKVIIIHHTLNRSRSQMFFVVVAFRFILSLGSCEDCIVMDDSLNVLPISSHVVSIEPVPPKAGQNTPEEIELEELKASLQDTQPIGVLINLCKTVDQARYCSCIFSPICYWFLFAYNLRLYFDRLRRC